MLEYALSHDVASGSVIVVTLRNDIHFSIAKNMTKFLLFHAKS